MDAVDAVIVWVLLLLLWLTLSACGDSLTQQQKERASACAVDGLSYDANLDKCVPKYVPPPSK